MRQLEGYSQGTVLWDRYFGTVWLTPALQLNLFPNRSPAAVQVQYSRLKNGRPRQMPGQGRGQSRRPGPAVTTPKFAPVKRSAATDSPRQPLDSPKRSRKSRRLTDGVDSQDPSSSEGESIPWDCDTDSANQTPSQSHHAQGWLQNAAHSGSEGPEKLPATPTAVKSADVLEPESVPALNETTGNQSGTPQANLPNTRLSPPDRFHAMHATVPAGDSTHTTPTTQPQPTTSSAPDSLISNPKPPNAGAPEPPSTSGNNSPAPSDPIRHTSGFTSVNQTSRSPSTALTPQGSAPARDTAHVPSNIPSMPPPPSVAARNGETPPLTPAPQNQIAAAIPPVPMPASSHTNKQPAALTMAAQPMSTPSQTPTPAPTFRTAQTPTHTPFEPAPPRLSSTEYFNKANEFMSRAIDAIVEEMTGIQRSQIDRLIFDNKTLQSSLSEITAERNSLQSQLAALAKEMEELKEDRKGMEEYIQKIGELAARFTRKE
ncbi:hypothetical protein BJX63DRAFT_248275 [Aspergillus granulosus]|uniref:Uncharacterized protein n=1 Tax=Aspergillus granulosus TaxID=176169 RepID=A0ABR4H9V4_9EURO